MVSEREIIAALSLRNRAKFNKLTVAVCAVVLALTLSAGLWPFSFHAKNNVQWDAQGEGLHFRDPAMAVSSTGFQGLAGRGRSIELWIEPDADWEAGTILAFYIPNARPSLQLRQSGDDFVFTTARGLPGKASKTKNIFVDHVFHRNDSVLITLSSEANVLRFYINGNLKKSASGTEMLADDFRGTLIIGNAPYGNLSWRGKFRGIAFYDRPLGANEAAKNYAVWKQTRADMTEQEPATLYLFNQGTGDRIVNEGKSGSDLVVPATYKIPEPGFLVPFWREYTPTAAYAKDLAINVFGLVPLGFCFAALFSSNLGGRKAWSYVVALGFLVSLTIELFQAFMPTRFSGTTDLMTNTAGTALGAWCYLNSRTQSWLARRIFFSSKA